MTVSRRGFMQHTAALGAASAITGTAQAAALFQPSYQSLAAHYQTPAWFTDAKFGIWAHWSPQCVPEQGDWYARRMYLQGERCYDHHLATYGHPSRTGFMEIDNLWRADQWEPDKLLDLYQRAGAKYFVALANHHDNFDTYDSTYHEWNAVRVGPKRDLIAGWAKATREHGLRFGVSNHSARSWHWFQAAYGYDAEGPMAGQRYDAFRLTREDGKGKWWDGLDPQNLYCGRHMVIPDGFTDARAMHAWHDSHDQSYAGHAPADDPSFATKWFLRCRELIDKYKPDLVYFDDHGLPLGQTGLDIAAHYYNANMQWHGGKLEAVLNAKHLDDTGRAGMVEDLERGFAPGIIAKPWQTDTCIGDWHYDRNIFEKHQYKSAETVIQRLCDVVSKNGNLLLSVPVRANGAIDEDEHAIVTAIGDWMAVASEGIYGTRPWAQFGEGPMKLPSGYLNEDLAQPYVAQDIRFTAKDGALYAFVMGLPKTDSLTIIALGAGASGKVRQVRMLGITEPLDFQQTGAGLTVYLPSRLPVAFVPALKIEGDGLTG